ncbi:MAG: Bug family tripartite tricarboxylate transporter substrate binding protein [Burkholderiales bacterium]|jgi:tripartite-type tricarboxylate transporter receptor subunit TctC
MRFGKTLFAAALALVAAGASAQAWPAKPIRLVVPFAVGSGTDIIARVIAEELQRGLGTNIVVDNKPGASGQIAADIVAKAPPDGYTLMMATNTSHSANPSLFRKLSYDPVKDFTPIARTNNFLFLLVVNAESPVRTTAELVARAKANPGKLTYAFGNSTGQVAGAHFARAGGFEAVAVPYKSTPPALTDLSGNQVDYMFVDWASSQSYIRGGKLKAIAVQADRRSSLMPELPAAGEIVPGFDFTIWGGLLGPAGLPREIVARLSTETLKVVASSAVKEKMAGLGIEPAPMDAETFARFVVEQIDAWGAKIRQAGIQPE